MRTSVVIAVLLLTAAPAWADRTRLSWPLRPDPVVTRAFDAPSPDWHRGHRGVVGRQAGSVAGYDYSPALGRARIIWNRQTLDAWLSDPEAFLPGQRMGYSVPDAKDRADIIAYLAQVSVHKR